MVMLGLRLAMGFIFLWAFLDKTFGLGISTKSANSWLNGVSPTAGYLSNGVQGPFTSFFHSLSGVVLVDWLFMLGLLFVGVTLIVNKYVKWGSLAGIAMMILIYLSLLWPANNPFVDEHVVYVLVLALIALKSNDQ